MNKWDRATHVLGMLVKMSPEDLKKIEMDDKPWLPVVDHENVECYPLVSSGHDIGFVAVHDRKDGSAQTPLYLFPAYRKHGFGRLLVIIAEEHCQKRGIKKVVHRVRPNNPEMLALSRRMGYNLEGEADGYCLMTKELS